MGKKERKKKKKANRNKKLMQREEINAISRHIDGQGRCLCPVERLAQAVTLEPKFWHLRCSNDARGRFLAPMAGWCLDWPRQFLLKDINELSLNEYLDLEENKDDLFSRLEDDILCHILSLVPFRFSVQTSLLSNRWRNLWRKAIEFKGTVEDVPRVITSVLVPFDNVSTDRRSSDKASQFLESLQISECKGLQSLNIEAGSRFQTMTILDCLQLNEIYFFAYNLRKLVFQGQLSWFCLKYSPNLESAVLDFRHGPGYNPFAYPDLILSSKLYHVLDCSIKFVGKGVENTWILFLRSCVGLIAQWEIKAYYLKFCYKNMSFSGAAIHTYPRNYYGPSEGGICSFWKEYSNRVANATTLEGLNVVKLKGVLGNEDEILLAQCLAQVASKELQLIYVN
ncbi:putative F-box family protein [Hibiscus syriacus]|uniref:F-box family protein n=1 Tax=Hibiscus syriacus TaxID=106335 RepID=A0A6A2ZL22_HIBSY|nr:putative F-box family protein [Hibiscus syriacus]